MNILMDRLEALLQTSFENGITLSLSKLEVGTSVKFAGFIVSDSVRSDGTASHCPDRLMFFELELCAVWWAAEKCDYYLRGIHEFKVITDHRPLVGLFKKPLASITNGRLQRLREKLNHYNFDCIWVAGKTHLIADALSRTPLFPADPELDASLREELCAAILTDDPIFASLRDSIDDDYKELREHVRQGRKFPQRVSPFHQVRRPVCPPSHFRPRFCVEVLVSVPNWLSHSGMERNLGDNVSKCQSAPCLPCFVDQLQVRH
eukprot:TCALIF_13555-PA protein Name:"Similar to pol Retrovirus-related Pol polyprotein from transposon 17.6 (Drosophila melanogaster)" AED:0.32 eAED:0.33 QI:0/0/0/0.66/1/1/3/0/261